MEILVNVIYDNHKLLEKLIKDRARFWGVKVDYETYEFLKSEVIQMYEKEAPHDKQMRQLWHKDERKWLESLSKERANNKDSDD